MPGGPANGLPLDDGYVFEIGSNHRYNLAGNRDLVWLGRWLVFYPDCQLMEALANNERNMEAGKYSSPDWKNKPTDPILAWWWTFWIIPNLLDYAAYKVSARTGEIYDLIYASIVTLISDEIGFPLYNIVIFLVVKIIDM